MQKRTKERRYNTDRAQMIHSTDGATLYRKDNGEYFLEGGGDITPLPYGTAKEWAKVHTPPAVYKSLFGKVEQGGAKTTYTFRLTAGAAELLKREAGQTGESLSDVIERAIWFLLT